MKPCRINPEMLVQLRDCISIGMSYSATSACLNISEDTFYSYMRKGKEGKAPYAAFYGAVRESEAKLMQDCLIRLRKVCDTGSLEAIKFILSRKWPQEFGSSKELNIKQKVEAVSLQVTAPATISETNALRESILERLRPKPLPP